MNQQFTFLLSQFRYEIYQKVQVEGGPGNPFVKLAHMVCSMRFRIVHVVLESTSTAGLYEGLN